MVLKSKNRIAEILDRYEADLLADWLLELDASGIRRDDRMKLSELREQCSEFLSLLRSAVQHGNLSDIQTPEWGSMRQMLADISRSRVQQGFSPKEVASFVFSFKKPLFARLSQELEKEGAILAEEIWLSTTLIDQLALWTTEVYQKAREEVIQRQQEEMLELSTPVVKLWEGILALPMIGTLDSARTQVVMEALLQQIVETGSQVVIIDITGVPTVDTLVAQHLLKTVAAARLMGTDCIISGIRPQIAQTIVHLGVDLSDVVTKATLADALALAMQRRGLTVVQRT
ncbi:STAS domain-containing protein [Microseira wollei]|uniref:Anti-sigma-factor antagonist n=1 Tax=Microseira wollei NIES-4236 TaxID=2530354 RepID=A0AAV3XAD1_9CYAN|nr:STAS domain-containing protein [Microseira wollei]GET36297.1 anti-sigma-factor antagonist [Microseira wollei NIES-4236]